MRTTITASEARVIRLDAQRRIKDHEARMGAVPSRPRPCNCDKCRDWLIQVRLAQSIESATRAGA